MKKPYQSCPGLVGITLSIGLLLFVESDLFAQAVPTPSSYWAGENSAKDSVGTNNGVLRGDASFAVGKVGTAFLYNTTNAAVRITASRNLDVGSGNGFTIGCWAYPSSEAVTAYGPLVEWNNSSWWGAHFFVTPPGYLYANIVDSNGRWHQIASAPGAVSSNVFQYLVVTYDKRAGVARLFHNGKRVTEAHLGSFTPQTSYDLYLGCRPAGDIVKSFNGMLDEISIYDRALSDDEIAAIYETTAEAHSSAVTIAALAVPSQSNLKAKSEVTPRTIALSSVQTNPSPILSIAQSGTNVILKWSVQAGDFSLQAADKLSGSILWTNIPATLQTNGDYIETTLPVVESEKYFRLIHP